MYCSPKQPENIVLTSSIKQTTGSKSLLFKYMYCDHGSAPLLSLLSSVMIWKTVKRTECITKTKTVIEFQVKNLERKGKMNTFWCATWKTILATHVHCCLDGGIKSNSTFLMSNWFRALTEIQIIGYDRCSFAPFLLNLVADVLFALSYFIVNLPVIFYLNTSVFLQKLA